MPTALVTPPVAHATAAPGATTVGVVGLGSALPAGVATNAALADRLGLRADWFARRTGVSARRTLGAGETLAGLAVRAGRAALADAGVAGCDVDLVVVATVSADDLMPACAVLVAEELGAGGCAAFDVAAACAGFVTALGVASGLLETGRARTALVLGADALSRHVDVDDRRTAGLFGDGAGAVVLRAAEGAAGVRGLTWGADGARADSIRAPRGRGTIAMDGHETYLAAVDRMTRTVQDVAAACEMTPADADLVLLHQANARITAAVAERLGLDPERVPDRIGEIGNVSAASVPVALDALRAEGRLRPGDRVICSTLGSGVAWAGCLLTWEPAGERGNDLPVPRSGDPARSDDGDAGGRGPATTPARTRRPAPAVRKDAA